MATTKDSPAPRTRSATTPAKKAAVQSGAKVPEDYLAKIREAVPDFVYPTSLGDIHLPGYMPTGFIIDNASLTEGKIFTEMLTENTDEDSVNIIRMLQQYNLKGVEGSLEDLMTQWFGAQCVRMGNPRPHPTGLRSR